jgi:hypothetical protein
MEDMGTGFLFLVIETNQSMLILTYMQYPWLKVSPGQRIHSRLRNRYAAPAAVHIDDYPHREAIPNPWSYNGSLGYVGSQGDTRFGRIVVDELPHQQISLIAYRHGAQHNDFPPAVTMLSYKRSSRR